MLVMPSNVVVYGPYTRDDGRQHVIVLTKDERGKEVERLTMSYPKFLVENILMRELGVDETVDHIDNDFTNNKPSNLRILPRTTHSAVDAIRADSIVLPCSWCGGDVTLTSNQRNQRARDKAGPFCNRSCTGKYGAFISNGGDPLKRQEYQVTYQRNK